MKITSEALIAMLAMTRGELVEEIKALEVTLAGTTMNIGAERLWMGSSRRDELVRLRSVADSLEQSQEALAEAVDGRSCPDGL